jgi:hypothetical protein
MMPDTVLPVYSGDRAVRLPQAVRFKHMARESRRLAVAITRPRRLMGTSCRPVLSHNWDDVFQALSSRRRDLSSRS